MFTFKNYLRRLLTRSISQTVLFVLIAGVSFSNASFAADDALPSWNDGATKQKILDFLSAATTTGSPKFIAESERIATFDQDGTLWVEQPLYAQGVFAEDRVRASAGAHPEWKKQKPYAAIIKREPQAAQQLMQANIEKVIAETHKGMSSEEFDAVAKSWLATARHPRFNKPYTQLYYQPMLELLQLLRSHGFQTYIVTGGPPELDRLFSEQVYGVQPQQVIGSPCQTKYVCGADGKPKLVRLPVVLWSDDRGGKPVAIDLMIGRRPVAAFGNSNGDRQMFEWADTGKGARLVMMVKHDDPVREYSYGIGSPVGSVSPELVREAESRGWITISMKKDWKKIFSWQ